MSDTQVYYLAYLVKLLVVFTLAVGLVPILVYAERRVSALMQFRWGPNRVGPFGLLQPFADMVKLLCKEDLVPERASKVLFTIAPALTCIPPFLVMSFIPVAPSFALAGREMKGVVVDSPVGILLLLALSSLTVYGLAIGGWASNSKYSLLGGLRSSAQMISYELAMGVSVLAVLCVAGTLNLTEIVYRQTQFFGFDATSGNWAGWNVFAQPLAFVIFLIAAFAETNRLPFDLPEAESELVGGYHTEYSSMKFSLFFMGEYIGMVGISSVLVALFLGGWHFPGMHALGLQPGTLPFTILGLLVFLAKIGVLLFFFIHVRWTLPRFRYDQLMRIGWKVLLPLALLNVLVTGAVVAGS